MASDPRVPEKRPKTLQPDIMGVYRIRFGLRGYRGYVRGYIGIMEKKMEATIWGLGFRNGEYMRMLETIFLDGEVRV